MVHPPKTTPEPCSRSRDRHVDWVGLDGHNSPAVLLIWVQGLGFRVVQKRL